MLLAYFCTLVIPLTGLDEFASDIESCKHVSASLGSFVIPMPKAEESSQSFICYLMRFFIRGSQISCAGFGFAALTSRLALRASPSVKLIWLPKIRKRDPQGVLFRIGVARFELTTFCSQSRRSTRLSYTPKCSKYSKDYREFK